jgi:hypothetical protein
VADDSVAGGLSQHHRLTPPRAVSSPPRPSLYGRIDDRSLSRLPKLQKITRRLD